MKIYKFFSQYQILLNGGGRGNDKNRILKEYIKYADCLKKSVSGYFLYLAIWVNLDMMGIFLPMTSQNLIDYDRWFGDFEYFELLISPVWQ